VKKAPETKMGISLNALIQPETANLFLFKGVNSEMA
jgi:hypothetical protein